MKKRIEVTWSIVPVIVVIVLFSLMLTTGSVNAAAQTFSTNELEVIVAPLALYADSLVSNILTASTIPTEVVQAAAYLREKGGHVTQMPDTDWDPSVKALLLFPEVLYKMNREIDWTRSLGYAVINQQQDVLQAIQSYRRKVVKAGNLSSNDYQKVTDRNNAIEITPGNGNIINVPVYNPTLCYFTGNEILTFLAGVAVADWWFYRNCNWCNNCITFNPGYFGYYNSPPGGYYWRIWGSNPASHYYHCWAPTPNACNSFHHGYSQVVGISNNNYSNASYNPSALYHPQSSSTGSYHPGSTGNGTSNSTGSYHPGSTWNGGSTSTGTGSYHPGSTWNGGGSSHAGNSSNSFHPGSTWNGGSTSTGTGSYHPGSTWNGGGTSTGTGSYHPGSTWNGGGSSHAGNSSNSSNSFHPGSTWNGGGSSHAGSSGGTTHPGSSGGGSHSSHESNRR